MLRCKLGWLGLRMSWAVLNAGQRWAGLEAGFDAVLTSG